ncbi:uncharacterized protein [Oscarella lobularis]|uniref:uncharacterized protein isoform X1 n=1 Tax=Oscarella lobularis TaxID=121494 RepID=UPI0033138B3D
MKTFMASVRERYAVGLVGVSDQSKILEQMGGKDAIHSYDYVFAENGLVAYKNGELVAVESIKTFMGEEKLKQLINFCLHYIADLDIPIKRCVIPRFGARLLTCLLIKGNVHCNGMLNVSPIGRNCSQEERIAFFEYDKETGIRTKFVSALEREFASFDLKFSIGGQISFDVFPIGWDKTYCLRHVANDGFDVVRFFGDKTFEGGNDHEIYVDPRTVGHAVKNPDDTRKILTDEFCSKREEKTFCAPCWEV